MAKWKDFSVIKEQEVFDPVERPAHYNQGGIECIDYIRQVLGLEGFIAYCKGNVTSTTTELLTKATLLKIHTRLSGT